AEKVNSIQEIYRTLYLRGYNITQAKTVIENELPDSEEKSLILDFINQSKKGILKMVAKDNSDEY
ncbi:MAG: acyl-[acyl-carrier-protein]--UDP-N-acetylglucosamine O-acyltransferase, partial [Ginsengibacter sp.]